MLNSLDQSKLIFDLFGGDFHWKDLFRLSPKNYICGFCNYNVSSELGYSVDDLGGFGNTIQYRGIYICPSCKGPTFFDLRNSQNPGPLIGSPVSNIPKDIEALYTEARKSYSVGAYTGSTLLSRKMLMNLSVSFGAEEGKSFGYYVDFLLDDGHVPKNSKEWIHHIRLEGNDATHKIKLKTDKEAATLLKFIEMLLKINFEYPSHISSQSQNKEN